MLDTFTLIFPLIFTAGVGFGCARYGFLKAEHLAGVSRFVFYVSIPAMLFINMLQAPLTQVVSLALFTSFYGPVIGVYLVALVIFNLRFKQVSKSAVLALGGSYSNTVLIGLPIAIAALSTEVAATVFALITFHSATLFLLTYLFFGKSHALNWRLTAKQLVINPVVLPIALGVVGNLMGIKLTGALHASVTLLAEPAIAGALFVLGANLHHYQLRRGLHLALLLSVLKLFVLPAGVWLFACEIFSLPREQVLLLVLLSGAPLGVNAYLVAKQLRTENDTLASTVVLSTLLSVVSYVFWLNWV
ncbi:AEC family transporter [Pseudoalteromonas sp. SSDWG2]|uniref:AEC family transporter n=1 Tax=Pseudoalteromonas sp. SSDWG2 TaxID=3139391 RepID=UPI003BA8EF2B